MNFEELLPKIQELGLLYGLAFVKAIAIFVIGRWIAKLVVNFANRVMKRSNMDETLRKFIRNILFALLMIFVIIATINQLGVQTASLIAIIGAAGLAVGLALQGSLANFAAGVLMILFKPYKIGDRVEVAGTQGAVEEVDILQTVLRLPDKTKVIIPNGQIMSDKITNYTDADVSRMDLVIGIGYDDDIDKARDVILKAAAKASMFSAIRKPSHCRGTRRQLRQSCGSSVDQVGTFPPASHDVTERIKKALDANGISIPFPQRDVHLYQHKD